MNTRTNKAEIAKSYYNHMLEGNFDAMENHLHPEITFTSPFFNSSGKEQVAELARNFGKSLEMITIRAEFESPTQAMLAYDYVFQGVEGPMRAAVLMGFKDALITSIELFFDTHPLR